MAKKTKTPENLPPLPSLEERTRDQQRRALKEKVMFFYDMQRLRIQCGNRIEKKRATPIYLHELDLARLEFRKKELEKVEKETLDDIKEELEQWSFYKNVLSDKTRYKGVGPTMAAVILSSYDIHLEDTVSKMWAFTGLRPMPCRRCRSCNKVVETRQILEEGTYRHVAHSSRWNEENQEGQEEQTEAKKEKKTKCTFGNIVTEEQTYESAQSQRPTKGEKLSYNAWLRTKMVGVLGSVLLKLNSPWRKFYDDYKNRKTQVGWGVSDKHRHNAAIRYMIKMLLLDIWREWRSHEGLVVRPSYQEEYLGHTHLGAKKVGKPVAQGTVANVTQTNVAQTDVVQTDTAQTDTAQTDTAQTDTAQTDTAQTNNATIDQEVEAELALLEPWAVRQPT